MQCCADKIVAAVFLVSLSYGFALPVYDSLNNKGKIIENPLKNWTPESKVNPEEIGPFFQGDMRFKPGRIPVLKNGLIDRSFRWPNSTLYYKFSENLSQDEIGRILAGFDEYFAKSCIKIIPAGKDTTDYIYFQNDDTGCWSYVGRQGGQQEINYQNPGCQSQGTIVHEILHALGFFHEHARWERDDWVRIEWQNIMEGLESNFIKYSSAEVTGLGVDYDYGSVMHYSAYGFSNNGLPTIVPLQQGAEIGQRIEMSEGDVKKLVRMYCRGRNQADADELSS